MGRVLMGMTMVMVMIACSQEEATPVTQRKISQKEQKFLKELKENRAVSKRKKSVYRGIAQKATIIKGGGMKAALIAPRGAMMIKGGYHAMPVTSVLPRGNQPLPGEKYEKVSENGLKTVAKSPLSTFSIDVDTASYALLRSMINSSSINRDGVRIEEMINYFNYEYPQPKADQPFSVTTKLFPSIFNKDRHMIQIGIQGRKIAAEKRKAANLVFLIDSSGSMMDDHKLPLLKKGFRLMVSQLTEADTVAIVTYAGSSEVVLQPTSGDQKGKIMGAIEALSAGGSTYGSGGLNMAYQLAAKQFNKDKINRIILATDGDFNVGISSTEKMLEMIKEKRKGGVTITTLGFGRGNYNDAMMEKIADHGNGNYAYIDSLNEAKKVLVTELSANMEVIARDVKIQVEFNPEQISYYRLIGYENRMLKKEDFNNDKVDAGEIGSGHSVTALYEVVFTDSKQQPVDNLRYQKTEKSSDKKDEIAFVKLRYKKPQGDKSILITTPVKRSEMVRNFEKLPVDTRFATAVAAFGLYVKQSSSSHLKFDQILAYAEKSTGHDEFGYRKELIGLMKKYEQIRK